MGYKQTSKAVTGEPKEVLPMNVAIRQSVITIGITPTALPSTALNSRKSINIYNNSAVIVYLGDSNVTIANGMPLPVAAEKTIDLGPDVVLYCIVAVATADVRILEGS